MKVEKYVHKYGPLVAEEVSRDYGIQAIVMHLTFEARSRFKLDTPPTPMQMTDAFHVINLKWNQIVDGIAENFHIFLEKDAYINSMKERYPDLFAASEMMEDVITELGLNTVEPEE